MKPVFNVVVQAMEVRTLGKHTILGEKNCETKDLFSPQPQMMNIAMNASSSLKLDLAVRWL